MSHYITDNNNINELYKYALDQSEYIIPEELFLNALFFNTAAALGLKNTRIVRDTAQGTKIIIPNFLAISLAKQGAGKDHSRNVTEEFFRPMFNKFERFA